jgi:hypothetical protein
VAIDLAAARARPGIVAVATFANVPELARPIPMRMSDRGRMTRYLQHPLARDKHLGLGRLYRRTGTREQAQERVATATTLYREMGMTYWLEQAEAER